MKLEVILTQIQLLLFRPNQLVTERVQKLFQMVKKRLAAHCRCQLGFPYCLAQQNHFDLFISTTVLPRKHSAIWTKIIGVLGGRLLPIGMGYELQTFDYGISQSILFCPRKRGQITWRNRERRIRFNVGHFSISDARQPWHLSPGCGGGAMKLSLV